MRVIDFRAGPNPAKRIFVTSLAQREGVDRVYTLVERDEVAGWTRLGFDREGSVPGFYKRSDAFILGTVVPRGPAPVPPDTIGVIADDSDKQYQMARRIAKELADKPMPPVKVQVAREPDVKRDVGLALRSGRALTGFEPFGRDVERTHYLCTARGGFTLMASVESQRCFSNAFVELLTAPRDERESIFTTAAIRALCDVLFEQEIVGCFGLSRVDVPRLGAAWIANGFRRTGRLRQHLLAGEKRVDAYLWSKKLAQPNDG
jgi:hypothetical protein